MRVLIVSQTYFPFLREGGRPTKVRAIAEGLATRGHTVTVLTSQIGSLAAPNDSETFQTIRGRYGQCTTLGGVDVVYLPSFLRRRTATLNKWLVDFCREELPAADIVHIFGIYDLLGPLAAYFAKRAGRPYLLETMGMFPALGRSRLAKQLYHGVLGGALARNAERVIVSSEQERGDVASRGVPETQIVVRRNGVSVPDEAPPAGSFRQANGISADARVALFLSRLVPEKGIELLLRAFARVLSHEDVVVPHRPWVLVIAGPCDDARYRARLTELAGSLGLRQSVTFVGPIYGNDKWAALRDATFLVQSSIRESFGNSIAEAMACGTPVVATDACGVMSLPVGAETRKAAIVVSHDEAELAEAMFQLGSDESLRQRLSAGCSAAARALDWTKPLDQLELLYEKLYSGRAGSRSTERSAGDIQLRGASEASAPRIAHRASSLSSTEDR